MNMIKNCPICGGCDFSYREVLWEELVIDWQLSSFEADYINRQQGFYCAGCANNLRSMALADAILSLYCYSGTLETFVKSDFAKTLNVLEINEAGAMTPILQELPYHQVACYPEYDITSLPFKPQTFDLVLHSDTLEHIQNPVSGLSECRRILVPTGRCLFTVPIVIGRLTRSREGLKESYHGVSGQRKQDLLVHTEFGADIWKIAFEAGFTSVRTHCLEYPSAFAIEASCE